MVVCVVFTTLQVRQDGTRKAVAGDGGLHRQQPGQQPADQQLRGLLVLADLAQRHSTRAVAVGLLHAAGGAPACCLPPRRPPTCCSSRWRWTVARSLAASRTTTSQTRVRSIVLWVLDAGQLHCRDPYAAAETKRSRLRHWLWCIRWCAAPLPAHGWPPFCPPPPLSQAALPCRTPPSLACRWS